MGRMVNCSLRDTTGCRQIGQVELSRIPAMIVRQERDAAEMLKTTGADHVLYAAKIYDVNDTLAAVQFYMNPMSDDEFYKVTGKVRGAIIYALHNRNRRWQ